MSDSEKLRVLDNDVSNFLTELTMSASLPKVETILIDGAGHFSSTCVLSAFLFKLRSELRALIMMFSIKELGYPAFLKQLHSSLRRFSSLSLLLIIFLSLKHPEYTIPVNVCFGCALLKLR